MEFRKFLDYVVIKNNGEQVQLSEWQKDCIAKRYKVIQKIINTKVMANKELKKFNVLNWDFNTDNIEHYDVLPYLRECVKKSKKKEPIETLDDMKKFVEQKSLYMFWSRCQYEMIIHGWPVQKNNYKIDVHEQVMMNIDTIAEILFNEIKK